METDQKKYLPLQAAHEHCSEKLANEKYET